MHDNAYIGGRSAKNIKCVVHDDHGWKNGILGFNVPLDTVYVILEMGGGPEQ